MRKASRRVLAIAKNVLSTAHGPPSNAITTKEFAAVLNKCMPPGGWPRSVGVALSGGPDSTCLLFLLYRHIRMTSGKQGDKGPRRLVSLTVNHQLQPSSDRMAIRCEQYARSKGIEHHTSKIFWGSPPFPDRPAKGARFETAARLVRYASLLTSMKAMDVSVIAFGHHTDDQVETALMRLGRGSTEYGAGGMRFCRRWGMGTGKEGEFGFYGLEGMNKWIVRPMLDFSKDRIIATCKANNLRYVTDRTNLQPHVTLRNAIRHRIQKGLSFTETAPVEPIKETRTAQPKPPKSRVPMTMRGNFRLAKARRAKSKRAEPIPLPPDMQDSLISIEKAVSSLKSVDIDLTAGPEHLRGAVKFLSSQVDDIDDQVDNAIRRCKLRSPPSTVLMSARSLSTIREHSVKMAMVLRIMRYVSFHPWGSLRADAKRSSASFQQVIDRVWNANPNAWHKATPFVAGAGVLWTPVLVKGDRIKITSLATRDDLQDGEMFGWLASRQPPLHRDKMAAMGIDNPLHRDVTAELADVLKTLENPSPVDVLYDCRFRIRFDVTRMPSSIADSLMDPSSADAIILRPNTRWYWPQVLHERDFSEVIHSKIESDFHHHISTHQEAMDSDRYWSPKASTTSDWITIEWARSLQKL